MTPTTAQRRLLTLMRDNPTARIRGGPFGPMWESEEMRRKHPSINRRTFLSCGRAKWLAFYRDGVIGYTLTDAGRTAIEEGRR